MATTTASNAQSHHVETPRTKADLKDLTSNANLQYSLKKYEEAAELYSEALQLQDELNGEMAPENAELHYLYGRCLFKVAVANSDVLGGQAATEKTKGSAQASNDKNAKSPLGINDADGDDEEDEEEEEKDQDGEDEEEDDMLTAYEILEVARVLFERQLENMDAPKDETGSNEKGKGKASTELTPEVRKITELLADTHDLQSEISLENEGFEDAAEESKSTLRLRQTLYPVESELIAEGYYKVAMAQEFGFFHMIREAKEAQERRGNTSGDLKKDVDPNLLFQAVENLVLAIQSSEARIKIWEADAAHLTGDEQAKKSLEIKDLRELIQEMFAKLSDLSNSAKSMIPTKDLSSVFKPEILTHITKSASILPPSATLSALEGFNTADPITGETVQKPGETAAERQARIDTASAGAKDLTYLVKKKKPVAEITTDHDVTVSNGNGKRKLDEAPATSDGKKVKFDEATVT